MLVRTLTRKLVQGERTMKMSLMSRKTLMKMRKMMRMRIMSLDYPRKSLRSMR